MAHLPTVVLVDDAPEVRTLLATRLRLSKQFDVVGDGANGADAVRLVTDLRPDVVVLDVSMPDMDGLDALSRIRAIAPDTKVVMFSGFEEHGLADRARDLGAVDFIEKSIPIEQLVERLAAVVEAPDPGTPAASPLSSPEPILQEHLERFRAAFDQAAIGMATLTLTGRIVRANAALESLVSADAGSLVGRPYDDLTASAADQLVKLVTEVASGERDVASVEHELTNGLTVVSTIAVVRDSAHTPLYLFLQVQDVSERRAAEEELRRSEERFRLLVEGVRDYAIFMLDTTGHIASWNLGAERAKGYTADEVLGRHFSLFYLQDAIDRRHPEYELEVAVREGVYEEEGWRKRKDGTVFWANVVITTIYDDAGKHIGFAKVTRDITERRRLLENLEAAAAERTQLLAVTAHELRTPVSVVNGISDTLQAHWDDFDEAGRQEMVATLSRTGRRLSRLVEDLFTAARLESGALEIRPSEFDLLVVAREAASDAADGILLEGGATHVVADRGRVQQMLANYLTNAIRYGATPITVRVRAANGTGQVVVEDRGSGVSQALEPQLFSKFATGGTREGTGLGLFIVRELARAQGGDAWYERRDGTTAFGMSFPLAG